MRKSRMAFAALVVVIVLAATGVAYARSIASYNLIVPKFGGTAYTGNLTKVNGSRGVDNNTANGAGYTLNTAIFRGSTRVTPTQGLPSGSRVILAYNSGQNLAGTGYRLAHSTSWTTYVDVQSRGSWSPDEY